MLDTLLSKGLIALCSIIVTVFGFVVWLDLTNVLFGPLDEIIYGVIVSALLWCLARMKSLGRAGKL